MTDAPPKRRVIGLDDLKFKTPTTVISPYQPPRTPVLPTPAPAPPPPSIPIIPRKERIAALVKTLERTWPAAFDPSEVRPLRIGSDDEIGQALAGQASKKLIGEALAAWTGHDPYLEALAREGARRVALDGSDAGPVTNDERGFAAQRLAERQARRRAEARR
jgi:hypothetical protein